MNRRDAFKVIGTTAVAGATLLNAQQAAARVVHDPLQHGKGRRQTGRIDLLVAGRRQGEMRSSQTIRDLAGKADFHDDAAYRVEMAQGTAVYTPATFPQNAIAVAIMEGMLTHKFSVSPGAIFNGFTEGMYFHHIDFIEGPDGSGKWISRVVDDGGATIRILPGAEVRQVIEMHVDEATRERHKAPTISLHALAVPMEEAMLFAAGSRDLVMADAGSSWTVTSGDWQAAGTGCARVQTCTPA